MYHKTHKSCKTLKQVGAATQPCRRRKAAGWQAFPNHKNGFVGFAGFVTKKEHKL